MTRSRRQECAPGGPEVGKAVEHVHVAGHAAKGGAQAHGHHQRAGLAGVPAAGGCCLAWRRRRLRLSAQNPLKLVWLLSCTALLQARNRLMNVILNRPHGTQLVWWS